MTIFYSSKTGQRRVFGGFLNLLFRWKGSVYKLMWTDLLFFLAAYYICSGVYRYLLNPHQQRIFEQITVYCEKYSNLIPVSFVLGFYVSLVVSRWWAQYKTLPWIDTLAIWVTSIIRGNDDRERMYRRTIMRYTCLTVTQCFALISPKIKKRFPTLEHYVETGLLLPDEKKIITDIVTSMPNYQTHWIPMVWASSLVMMAREENIIKNDTFVRTILDEMNKIKDLCNHLLSFDRICVPLVYTQVVTLAVYSYFLSCVMGRQWLYPEMNKENSKDSSGKYGVDDLDLIIPVFTILQFFFYMGWLKVAETLENPFGDDDTDFELQWMVDRSLLVSYLITDEMHGETPSLIKDLYFNEMVPGPGGLPHTKASIIFPHAPPPTSTANVIVPPQDREMISPLRPNFNTANVEIPESLDARRSFFRNYRRKFLVNLHTKKWKVHLLSRLFTRNRKANGSISSASSHSNLNQTLSNLKSGIVIENETEMVVRVIPEPISTPTSIVNDRVLEVDIIPDISNDITICSGQNERETIN